MIIHFWGVRASIPTPSTLDFVTSRYGGNTTCLSVQAPGVLLILDAGSGLRTLGLRLAKACPFKASFFFSHVHWDHIQGFPFFTPAFMPGNTFDLYGPAISKKPGFLSSILEKALRGQQEDLNFPVSLSGMGAKLNFFDLVDGASVTLPGTESTLVVTADVLGIA